MGNIIVDKSKVFAIDIVNIYRQLTTEGKEFILSKQLLRSGTSIGANVAEAVRGQTKADFRAKMNIALKEASETEYWLALLKETNYLSLTDYEHLNNSCNELIRLLVSITKNSEKIKKKNPKN